MSLIQPQAALFEPDSETICETVHTTEEWASFTCVCGNVLIMCKKIIHFTVRLMTRACRPVCSYHCAHVSQFASKSTGLCLHLVVLLSAYRHTPISLYKETRLAGEKAVTVFKEGSTSKARTQEQIGLKKLTRSRRKTGMVPLSVGRGQDIRLSSKIQAVCDKTGLFVISFSLDVGQF